MKKIISLFLAVMMACSVMTIVSMPAFAKLVYEFENSSVKSIEISFDKKTINEHTHGFWETDENGERFFYYMVSFAKGDVLVMEMADGTKHTFTYKEKAKYDYETGKYFDAFSDETGRSLQGGALTDQRKEHWGVGSHIYKFQIDTYVDIEDNIICEIPVDIVKMPFADLGQYDIYNTYVAYTSIYNEFLKGTNPPQYTEFSPSTSITRGMLVAILYRMAGNPYDNSNQHTENPFTDIQPGVYYYNAACWALDEGITNQTTFKPNDNVTREQTARFLFAYAEAKDMLGDEAYKDVDLSDYPDYGSVHSWAIEPLQWANHNNMITGTQQGYINPIGATQRIHATRILYGFGRVCNIGNFS